MRILVVTDKYALSHDLSNGYRVGKAFESLGHEVCFASPEMASAKAGSADFILGFSSLLSSFRLFLNAWISKAKKPGTKFAMWIFDSCSEIDAPSRALNVKIKAILPHIDMLITTDHSYPWEKYISNYLHLFQGIDEDEFKCEPSSSENRSFDVIFAGNLYDRYPERAKSLRLIGERFKTVVYSKINMEKLMGLTNVTLKNKVYNKDFFDVHQQAKITFIPRPPLMIKSNYWSNRIYLATATGTCCLVEYVKGLEEEFENEKEVFYSYNDEDTILKTRFLLANPKLRIKLGQNARKRTLENYKYSDRVKKILEAL